MVTAVRVTRTVTRAAAFSCVFAADVLVSSAGACGRCGRRGCGGGLGMQLARFGVWRSVFVGVVVGALGFGDRGECGGREGGATHGKRCGCSGGRCGFLAVAVARLLGGW